MTVRELMEILADCPADAVVRMPDTYWANEGYGSRANDFDSLFPEVTEVAMNASNEVILSFEE